MNSLRRKIQLPPGGHYIVAVSGGVDSIALLHLLASMEAAQNWRLRVAHFNHGIRSDSRADQELVRSMSRVYGLPFHTENGGLGDASEEVARKARYDFLRRLMTDYQADAIITAHHFDDRQETSLFNLARGSGTVGAAALRSERELIRPLLGVRKAELIDYAKLHGLPWREDSTNADIKLSRNFIRNELLPFGRKKLPQFDRQFGVTLDQLDYLNQAMQQRFGALVEHGRNSLSLSRQTVALLELPTLQQVLVYMARSLEPSADMSKKTLQKAAQLARIGTAGQEASLTGKLMLRIAADSVMVYRVNQSVQALVAQELLPNGSVRFGGHQLSYGVHDISHDGHHHVIPDELKVRTVRPGDRVAQLGMSGTKKLQDLFVDAKIDRSDRLLWPVVARIVDDQVVWVPRLAVSRHFSVPHDDVKTYCLIHEVVT